MLQCGLAVVDRREGGGGGGPDQFIDQLSYIAHTAHSTAVMQGQKKIIQKYATIVHSKNCFQKGCENHI